MIDLLLALSGMHVAVKNDLGQLVRVRSHGAEAANACLTSSGHFLDEFSSFDDRLLHAFDDVTVDLRVGTAVSSDDELVCFGEIVRRVVDPHHVAEAGRRVRVRPTA